jgi:hypothetical protein
MQNIVEIARFDNPVEAHILRDLLVDAGIPAHIFDEHAGSALPHIGAIGVRVVVRAQDAARAAQVIAEDEAAGRASPRAAAEEMDWRGAGEEGDGEGLGGKDDEVETAAPSAGDATSAETSRSSAPGWNDPALLAWAHRTRTIAVLRVGFWPFAFAAIFRTTRPPPGIESSERAVGLVRQARWIAYLTILGVSVICYTFAVR